MSQPVTDYVSPVAAPDLHRPVARIWRSTSLTRLVSLTVFAAIAAWILLRFHDYGISNDEIVQHRYGELLLAWYGSGFTDESVFSYINLYMYGGLFDLIAAGFEKIVPWPLYEWRHLLSAGFGFAGLIAVWRLAKLLGSEKAGILAVLMLAFTGMYGGAMFTHTKDVPFAATMAWSLYFITALAVRLPSRPSWGITLGLGLAIGCTFGLRVGGVFAVFYLMLTIGAASLVLRDVRLALALLPRLMAAGLIALAIMAVTWPWSVLPPTNFFKAMGAFNNFAFDLKTLFNGVFTPIDQIPSTYMAEYLLIKLPEITLFGLAVTGLVALLALPRLFARGISAHHPRRVLGFLPLLLAIAVPILFTLLDAPPLYNGIRHFLFVLPPVTVLAALGVQAGWRWMLGRSVAPALAFAAMVLTLLAYNATSFLRMHPYEYVAYNRLVGGTAGAWGRFEADYWSTSLREAALNLRARVEHEGRPLGHPYTVAVCAEDPQVSEYLGPNFVMVEDWDDADFVMTARNIGCDTAMDGMPFEIVSRAGIPIAVTVDHRSVTRPDPTASSDDADDPTALDDADVFDMAGMTP